MLRSAARHVPNIVTFLIYCCGHFIVDCEWKPWITETVNGYTRECKKLKCTKDGKEPERAAGKRDRRILREAGPGGRQCRGRSLQDCEGDCPGM